MLHSSAGSDLPCHIALLGYGGLLPFAGLATLLWIQPEHASHWTRALYGYGAVILSFVGALHWGVAMSSPMLGRLMRRKAFIWSVVPALIGWPATFTDHSIAGVMLIAGFWMQLYQDHKLAGSGGLPEWYLPLRWQLSVVATCCLAAAILHSAVFA
ncbi:DUF3429 domain-containing protein [Undibacterium luofuense]|uniref:DUF3429 domain-containing protein n=1 Tax=Undibacterium luofuense TaxID=2828733 RepID=A0A941I5H8_9BURK|nr:DUF3429 domain-containing protein [Undibacterium luofuense]MBR7781601.1 DUF3429 domain-containing protein [Undibacterium luofuense]